MKFVFIAIALAIFTQTLTNGLPVYEMADSFVAMSTVVFLSGSQGVDTLVAASICLCHHPWHPDLSARYSPADMVYWLSRVSFLSVVCRCWPLLLIRGWQD